MRGNDEDLLRNEEEEVIKYQEESKNVYVNEFIFYHCLFYVPSLSACEF